MKRLMMLGGNFFQMSATIRAKEMGYYVISCDYLPNNPAHKYADEYYNISTIDKEEVLTLAKKLKIDGIMSYASDVSAETVSYVAEKLNLPGNPLSAINILTNKHKFREFLRDNGFNCPKSKSFHENEFKEFCSHLEEIDLPVMIKPVDSSGSKGLTKLTSLNNLDKAYDFAMGFSKSKTIMVEDYIERKGSQLEMEGFIVDGEIKFFVAMDQHCDEECTKFSPVGSSVPTSQSVEVQKKAKKAAQKVFDLLGMKFGSFNFEYVIDNYDNLYIMEIGPRNGGNFIPDMINYSQGVNLADYAIKSALGEDCSDICNKEITQCVSYYLIHSRKNGVFRNLDIDEKIKDRILKIYLYIEQGDPVKRFIDGRMGLGVMIIKFDDLEQKNCYMQNMSDYVRVIVD